MDKDKTFMGFAQGFAQNSHCVHFKVGVVFSRGVRFLSGGYNGPPRGEPHCDEIGCAKLNEKGERLPAGSGLCRGAHAEMNALANAAAEGIALKDSTAYCTLFPCFDCAKVLANLPIVEFVYCNEYPDEDKQSAQLFLRRGIALRQYKIKEE